MTQQMPPQPFRFQINVGRHRDPNERLGLLRALSTYQPITNEEPKIVRYEWNVCKIATCALAWTTSFLVVFIGMHFAVTRAKTTRNGVAFVLNANATTDLHHSRVTGLNKLARFPPPPPPPPPPQPPPPPLMPPPLDSRDERAFLNYYHRSPPPLPPVLESPVPSEYKWWHYKPSPNATISLPLQPAPFSKSKHVNSSHVETKVHRARNHTL